MALEDPRTLRQSANAGGGIGALHVGSADLGPTGLFRFSAEGEYFGARNFPVTNSRDVRTSGTFALSYVPFSFLEGYLSYSASANSNTNSSPTLIQALGDISLGAKGAQKWLPGFYAGLDLRLTSYSGVGNQDVRRFAFAFFPSVIGTFDARAYFPKVPLRLHANLGLALDGTGGLVRQHTLSAAEEFALGVNQYNRFTLGVALEAPLPVIAPFVEYNLGVPLGVPGGVLTTPDGDTLRFTRAMPQKLGVGFKVTAVRDITFLAALDIGLTPGVGLGVPATPPLNFLFAASFAVDPVQREKTRLVETVREKEKKVEEPPKLAKVSGIAVDAKTKKPLPGVIIAMVGPGLPPPVASDLEGGHFLTQELPPGTLKLSAVKDGYKQVEQEVILQAGQTTSVEFALEAQARKSRLALTITADKKPVAATVTAKNDKGADIQVPVPASAKEPTLAEIPPGQYTLEVVADGYLAQTREVLIGDAGDLAIAFALQPEPKQKLVVVKDNKIQILQQVHFAFNQAVILPDSYQLLAQVVDAIVKSDIKRLRVEGHTDNRGTKAANQQLSDERAKAVAAFLESSGIDKSRVDAAGYGDTRPIAPNLTARGRELNRRVEFIILDR